MLDRVKAMKDNSKADSELLDIQRDLIDTAILLDFYGLLLTSRQFEILDLHYNSDLSLGEIAEDLGISRQAAHDTIRKGKTALADYEERLGLVKRFRAQENNIREALSCLKNLEKRMDGVAQNDDYVRAIGKLNEIMDTL